MNFLRRVPMSADLWMTPLVYLFIVFGAGKGSDNADELFKR